MGGKLNAARKSCALSILLHQLSAGLGKISGSLTAVAPCKMHIRRDFLMLKYIR